MTFVRANPASWALFELLTSTQMNLIDDNLTNALDGLGGGDYAPSDQLLLDGSGIAGAGRNTLKLVNTQLAAGLYIDVSGGSGNGLNIVQSADTEAIFNMVLITGTTVSSPGTAPGTAMIITGHTNPDDDGGAAIKAFGGATGNSGSFGGRGLYGEGGDGEFGGYGVDARAGDSNFVGFISGYQIGRAALHADGGTLVGDDDDHYASPGLRSVGGDTSGTGHGGPGSVMIGGLGPLGLTSAVDAGVGSVSRGSSGILASTTSVDPLNLPSDFDDYVQRAAGSFYGKTYGSGITSLFSGNTTDTTYYNQFGVVGAGASIGNKILVGIFTDVTSTPAALVTGLEVNDFSGLTNFEYQPIFAAGKGAPMLKGAVSTRNSIKPPHLHFSSAVKPTDEYVDGGLIYMAAGAVTGLLDACYFIGSDGRLAYDRVVTSGDRAALQAWGIARLDGSGGIVNGSNYGIVSCAFGTDLSGTPCIRFTLDTIAGQPLASSMIAFGSWSATSGYLINAYVEDATHITVTAQQMAGGFAYINFATFPFPIDVNCMVIGTPAIGAPADRPSYFVP